MSEDIKAKVGGMFEAKPVDGGVRLCFFKEGIQFSVGLTVEATEIVVAAINKASRKARAMEAIDAAQEA